MMNLKAITAAFGLVLVSTPASAAPLLYSYYENGSQTARFTFTLDSKPIVIPLGSYETRKGFGVLTDLTLFWSSSPGAWYIQFQSAESGGGFIAGEAFTSGIAVGQQLFTGTTAAPTMLEGRFNLVDQYFGTTAVLTVAAIPEPATWTMLLTGFAMVGGAVRYRRRTTKIAYA